MISSKLFPDLQKNIITKNINFNLIRETLIAFFSTKKDILACGQRLDIVGVEHWCDLDWCELDRKCFEIRHNSLLGLIPSDLIGIRMEMTYDDKKKWAATHNQAERFVCLFIYYEI